jgi:hypothetical protein
MGIIMQLEILPNEILIECFDYLSAIDIFRSFDQLNYRLNKLIRNIPLHLSNNDIHSFLSFDEFVHLRSLTLIGITYNNLSKLKAILSSISQLSCFRLIDTTDGINEILSALSVFQLRILTVPEVPLNFNLMHEFPLITNLTIFECNVNRLSQLFTNASNLKYLTIHKLTNYKYSSTINDVFLTNLRQLIIKEFQSKFDHLVMILKQTPKLESLTISNYAYFFIALFKYFQIQV